MGAVGGGLGLGACRISSGVVDAMTVWVLCVGAVVVVFGLVCRARRAWWRTLDELAEMAEVEAG